MGIRETEEKDTQNLYLVWWWYHPDCCNDKATILTPFATLNFEIVKRQGSRL